MPSTRNLRHLNLNLNMCFSNSTTPESKSPPTSPIHATSSPYASIMIKNFNSLYDPIATSSTFDNSSSFTTTTTSTSSEPDPEPADFAAAFASQRFFFSSPGPSNSLTNCNKHSSPLIATNTNDDNHNPNGESEKKNKKNKSKKALFNGSVAVSTYSPDPYLDFRRSMQEMVEARPELMDVKSNWKILHELLLCYLALNPKSTHKFILGAFADLLVSLMPF